MTPEFYKELWDKYQFSLVLFATSKVGEFLAQDYVQDAYLELWRLKDKGHKNPKSFLYTMVYHRCLNHLRDTGRVAKNSNEIRFMLDVSEDYIEAQITKGFYVQKLIEGINSLPERQKKVIKLYHGGYTPQEIAKNLEIDVSTVWGQVKKFIDGFIKLNKKKIENQEAASLPQIDHNKLKEAVSDNFKGSSPKEDDWYRATSVKLKMRIKKDMEEGHISHCVNGHEYTEENKGFNNQGYIYCKACKKKLNDKYRLLRKSA